MWRLCEPAADEIRAFLDGRVEFELHVLDKNRHLVLSRYDGVVERRDLHKLAALIKESSGSAKEFFEVLEATGNG